MYYIITLFLAISLLGTSAWGNTIYQQQPKQTNHAETKQALPTQHPSPLLYGLSAEDIAQAEKIAQRSYQRHWLKTCKRSRYVRHRLIKTLKALGAPLALQLVPVVESGYNPYALSYAGALGLWQLMPATAKGLTVTSNHRFNGRRSIEESTDAAVRYLLQLHDRFDSWPLALAAYNIGLGSLSRRLRASPWDYSDGLEHLPVPASTRLYVQQIIGLASLLQKKKLSLPDPLITKQLHLEAPVDLNEVAKVAKLDPKELFFLNPGLNQSQYFSQSIHIHLPTDSYERVRTHRQEIAPRFSYIQVRSGDSLWKIAKKHHLSLAMIRHLNPRLGKFLQVGQRLKVPAATARHVAMVGNENPLLHQPHRLRYKVRSGDSLWRIAKRFGTTPRAIARINNLSLKKRIHIGDRLWILARPRA